MRPSPGCTWRGSFYLPFPYVTIHLIMNQYCYHVRLEPYAESWPQVRGNERSVQIHLHLGVKPREGNFSTRTRQLTSEA